MSVVNLEKLLVTKQPLKDSCQTSSSQSSEEFPWSTDDTDAKSFHAQTVDIVSEILGSSIADGLTESLANSRLHTNGMNEVLMPNAGFLRRQVLLAFFGGFAPILYLAVVMSFVAYGTMGESTRKDYILVVAGALLVIVLLNGIITVWQEFAAARIMQSKRTLMPRHSRVKRDGAVRIVKTTHLVVGDLIELRAGDQIPTDMRVVSADNMTVDKSWLTGESRQFKVNAEPQAQYTPYLDAQCMLFVGSTVANGSGWGLAVTTGPHNQVSKVLHMATRKAKPSSLHQDINMIGLVLSTAGIAVAVVVVAHWAFYSRVAHPEFITASGLLIRLVFILISVIPLSLPVVISGGLSIASTKLKNNWQVLTRKLGTIETLGTISMLVTDKTGTLTQNKLAVTDVITLLGDINTCGGTDGISCASYRVAALCNHACLDTVEHCEAESTEDSDSTHSPCSTQPSLTSVWGSNATDRCILNWANANTECGVIRAAHDVLYTEPFKSEARVAMVVVQHKSTRERLALLKGAPEQVMPLCSWYLNREGEPVEWEGEEWQHIVDSIRTKASAGQRMIVLAQMGPLSPEQDTPQRIPDTGFTFVSCLALSDPIRSGTKETIKRLRTAGIKVTMVTGDSVETALSIAKQSGIVGDPSQPIHKLRDFHRSLGGTAPSSHQAIVLSGKQMLRLTPAASDYVRAHSELIIARMASEQRVQLVKNCALAGHIVAVTGDGINDTASFHEAHVAVAMNNAPEVTRESGDVVLLTDDFSAMYEAVKYGRLVFANLRKALAFMLATAIGLETVVMLSQFFLGLPTPLNKIQIILIGVVHNLLGGLALMYEPAEPALMTTPPRNPQRQRLLDWRLAAYSFLFYGFMLGIGGYYNYFDYMRSRGFTTEDLLYAWDWNQEIEKHTPLGTVYEDAYRGASSVFYVTLVVGQAFHLMSLKLKVPYFSNSNMPFPWITLLSAILSVLASTPFLYIRSVDALFNIVPVSARYWGLAVGWSALWFAVAEARKWIVFLYPHSWLATMDW